MEYWGWAEGRSTIRLVMGGEKAIESFRPGGFGPTGVEPFRFVCLEDLGRRRGHPASPPMRDEAAPEWGTQFVQAQPRWSTRRDLRTWRERELPELDA
jgi:hypothetical protein